MGYQHLQNTLKAIALTVPAARAFEMTVEFVLGQGKDTATVGRLEDHFRDRPPMKTCIERMKKDPATRKSIDERLGRSRALCAPRLGHGGAHHALDGCPLGRRPREAPGCLAARAQHRARP